MEQLPLTQEKHPRAEALFQEQLDAGHVEPTTSPRNSPIFVIKKKKIRKMEIVTGPQEKKIIKLRKPCEPSSLVSLLP